jgi:hypothetical protein
MESVPERFAVWALLLGLLFGLPNRALAQAETRGALADAWLDAALTQQSGRGEISRFLGGPLVAAGGAALLIASPLSDLRLGAKAWYMGAGGLFLTAAVGLWANPEYESQRWYTRFGSLAFVALGIGAIFARPGGCDVSPFAPDSGCSAARRRIDRGVLMLDLSEVSFFFSVFLLDLITPPSSPTALELELRSRGADARYDRVMDFLQQRERRRRTMDCVTVPAYLAFGGGFVWVGTGAATSSGRALTYSLGIGLAAIGVATLIYELVRVPDWKRMERGEGPSD